MIRISAKGDLEAIRYWRENEDKTMADLLVDLRHEAPANKYMLAGGAFAEAMEHIGYGDFESIEAKGWKFNFKLDKSMVVPVVRELKAEMPYSTPSGDVTLVGVCDGLNGTELRDAKLTENPSPEKYLESWQWKAYLVLFGAQSFTYDLFKCRPYDEVDKEVTIIDYIPLTMYRYPGIEQDVQNAVNEAAEIISKHCPERVKP
jgi:hypothetical protein